MKAAVIKGPNAEIHFDVAEPEGDFGRGAERASRCSPRFQRYAARPLTPDV